MSATLRAVGSEHDANGHYLAGPRLKQPSLWRLIPESPEWDAPTPSVALGRQQIARRRARRALSMHERHVRLAQAIRDAK